MKRISIVLLFKFLLALLISSHAFASNDKSIQFSLLKKSRFYGGVQIGEDNYQTTTNFQLLDDDTDLVNMNPSISAQGIVGGVLLGYGYFLPYHLYLAAETYFNLNQASSSMVYYSINDSGLDIDQLNSQFQVNHSYGLSLLPGIKLNSNFLVYLRLGLTWTSFTSKQYFNIDKSLAPNNLNIYFNKSARSRGINLGFGVETFITKFLSLRGEYSHINYSSFTNSTASYNSQIRLTPHDHQVMLSAIYSFNAN